MYFLKIKITLLAILLSIAAHTAQTLAVLEILPISEELSVNTTEMRHLTDELRRQAVQSLPKTGYAVLTRDNMFSLLPPDSEEAECLAESCAVEIGRAIGAEYVSQGKIGSFGGDLSLSIELYDAMSGKLLGSIVMESNDVKGLMSAIREQAPALFVTLNTGGELKLESEPITLNSPLSTKKKSNTSFYIALSLDILGAVALGFGIYQHTQKNKLYEEHKNMDDYLPQKEYDNTLKKADDARVLRDIGFITSGVLLGTGIMAHIWF